MSSSTQAPTTGSGASSTSLGSLSARRSRARTVRFYKVRSADGTVIEAWTNNAQGPVLLICNGLGTNAYAWPELLNEECGIRVISWNHRGVGRSSRPEDPERVGVDAFVEDALAVLDDAGIDTCVVAGWSIGVNTAFELAARHPERVAGLFAVAGVPGGTFASMGAPLFIPRPLRRPLTTRVAKVGKIAGPALTAVATRVPMGPISTTALRFSGFMMPMAKPSEVRRAVREFLTTPMDWYMHLAVHASQHDRVSLSSIDVPAVFISGRFDVLADTKDMRTAAQRMNGAIYRELFGTHFIPLERSGTIMTMLHEFMDRIHADIDEA